jgi:hypothetical protein
LEQLLLFNEFLVKRERAHGGGVVKLVYFPFGNKNADYRCSSLMSRGKK